MRALPGEEGIGNLVDVGATLAQGGQYQGDECKR